MAFSTSYSRPYSLPYGRTYAGLGLDVFALLDLSPSLYLDPAVGVSTGGSRKLTAGDKAHFEVASNADLQAGDADWWGAAWVYWDGTSGTTVVMSKDLGVGTAREYSVRINTGQVQCYVFDSGGANKSVIGPTLLPNQWQLLLFWHDNAANTINLRVSNGSTGSTDLAAVVINAASEPVRVGADGQGRYHGGRISRVAFGKPATPIADLIDAINTSLWNNGNGKSYGDLTGAEKTDWGLNPYYNLNENSGTAYDAHGSNDLTPTFAELLSNTGFETLGAGGADVFASWGETTSGTGTVAAESVIVQSGSRAFKADLPASGDYGRVDQSVLTVGNSYTYSVPARNATGGVLDMFLGTALINTHSLTASYTTYTATGTAVGTSSFQVRPRYSGAAGQVYVDNVSVKAATIPGADGPATSTGVTDGDLVVSHLSRDSGAKLAVQTTAASRPVWKDDILNGLPVLRGDGVDDYMTVGVTDVDWSQPWHAFCVASNPSSGTGAIFSVEDDNGGEHVGMGTNGGSYKVFSNGKTAAVGGVATADADHIFELAWDGSAFHLFVNGALDYSVTPSSAIIWADLVRITLFARLSGTTLTNYAATDIALGPFVVSGTLPESTRDKVNKLLSREFGIALA